MRFYLVVTSTLLQVVAVIARVAASSTQGSIPTSISYWNRKADSIDPLAQHRRAATTATEDLVTCGYEDGNVDSARSAGPGFDCRVDTAHGLWGFCPTTVIAATDCGFAAACIDSGSCSDICYINPDTALTTFTCPSSGSTTLFCSTAMLTFGVDQTYGYIACAGEAKTDHYVVTPTFTPSSSTASPSQSSLISSAPPNTSATPSTSTRSLISTPISSSSSTTAKSTDGNSSSAPETKTQSTGSNIGAIIGGVLGGIALICLSAVAVVFIIKRRGSQNPNDGSPPVHDLLAVPPYSYPQPHSGSQVYEVDSTSSIQNHAWKDPNLQFNQRSPVELPSHTN